MYSNKAPSFDTLNEDDALKGQRETPFLPCNMNLFCDVRQDSIDMYGPQVQHMPRMYSLKFPAEGSPEWNSWYYKMHNSST